MTTSPTPAEHTALPWSISLLQPGYIVSDADDFETVCAVAEWDASKMPDPEWERRFKNSHANAALIVTAVNERAGLLERVRKLEEALRKSRNQVVAFAIPHIGAEDAERVVAYIDAALQPEQETAK